MKFRGAQIAQRFGIMPMLLIGVFRPSVTTFFLSNSNESPNLNIVSVFGQAGDFPVAGDWDGKP